MKLSDLNARLVARVAPCAEMPNGGSRTVYSLAEADGVMFQCPQCAAGKPVVEEDGKRFVRGAHYIMCWFRGRVPDDVDPRPGRWTPSGTGLADLTFVPGEPPMAISVLLTSGCCWHGFVRNGEAE